MNTARMERGRKGKDQYAKDRQAALISGELDVSELSMRELMKGRVTNADGSFPAGRLPKLPQKVLHSMTIEVVRRAKERVKRYGDRAMELLIDMATDEEAPHAVRLGAIKMLAEYSIGKPTENVVIKSSDPWQDIIDEVLDTERTDGKSKAHDE